MGDITNSQSLNRYCYVQGNPLSYVDPFGLSPLSILCEIGHGILMVLGFVPEWGFIADALNAIWYAAEKKPFEAFCSAVSAIPGAGDKFAAMVQVGKITSKVFKNTKLIKTISHLMGNIGSLCIAGVNVADSGDNLIKALKGEEYEGTILGNYIMFGLSILSGVLSTAGIIKKAKDLGNLVKPKPTIGSKGGSVSIPSPKGAYSFVDEIADGVCFVAGTQIKTVDGQKNIEDIKVGDMVYAKNTESGEEGYKEVVNVFIKETDRLVYLQVGDEEIVTTETHPFYLPEEGFIEASKLQADDMLLSADGTLRQVTSVLIKQLKVPVKVYNFEVKDWHTYYVSDVEVLVHNKCNQEGITDFVVSPNGIVEAVGNGQHVLKRHVGLSDNELLLRLKNNSQISGVSTFIDDITANNVIGLALRDSNNVSKIDNWISKGPIGKLVIDYNGNANIGRGVSRGINTIFNMTNAKIILKTNGKGGFDILTAYPIKYVEE